MAQLDDSNCSFYLALAESKRFRLGHIRNGKISDRLYPKRKDFVSLNVAIQNQAAILTYAWSYNTSIFAPGVFDVELLCIKYGKI